jgi:hypothetical protein
MQSSCDFEIKVALIQHVPKIDFDVKLDSVKLSTDRLELVKKWSDDGKYYPANIIKHSIDFPKYPHLPSLKIGLEFAIKENADFHLWLEDDALILDNDIGEWPKMMENNLVGVYHLKKAGYINAAYMLSSINFDKLLLKEVNKSNRWDMSESMYPASDKKNKVNLWSKRLEPTIARLCQGKLTVLNAKNAARINLNKKSSSKDLVKIILRICPNEIELLHLDFDQKYIKEIINECRAY